ncbi:MAG: hypothetical protein FJ125_08680 [Deltaproteobacteria bacterium]|nr:hypothetical protein [Deltaproteobacteria bacterium]
MTTELSQELLAALPAGIPAEAIAACVRLSSGIGDRWGEARLLLAGGRLLVLTRRSLLEPYAPVALESGTLPRLEESGWQAWLLLRAEGGAELRVEVSSLELAELRQLLRRLDQAGGEPRPQLEAPPRPQPEEGVEPGLPHRVREAPLAPSRPAGSPPLASAPPRAEERAVQRVRGTPAAPGIVSTAEVLRRAEQKKSRALFYLGLGILLVVSGLVWLSRATTLLEISGFLLILAGLHEITTAKKLLQQAADGAARKLLGRAGDRADR